MLREELKFVEQLLFWKIYDSCFVGIFAKIVDFV